MGKIVLVTGGLGFIGTRLIARLLEDDPEIRIRILDNFSVGTLADLSVATGIEDIAKGDSDAALQDYGRISVLHGDIRNLEDLKRALPDVSSVIHLAAQTGVPISVEQPMLDFETNVVALVNMLDIVRQMDSKPRIVFASSNAPLGQAVQPVSENSLPSPIAPYGASKLTGEVYLKAFGEAYGIQSVTLRFGNVYGPGSEKKTSVVAKFIKQALVGDALSIFGDGSQTRDFIHIDDLVDAIFKSMDVSISTSELFQISSGCETDIRSMTDMLCSAFEKRGITRPDIRFEEIRHGDMPKNVSDVSKAKEVLGWQTKRALDEGILETLDWFLEKRKN